MTGRVLVTGATGFVGRGLIPRLMHDGWRVRAAARDPAAIPSAAGVDPVQLPDLSAAGIDWQPLTEGVTHIVHLAGLAHATARIPESTYMAVNADATRSLAAAAREVGVQRMVLISSIRAQVGPVSDKVVREVDAPLPTDAYGRSKLAAERMMFEALQGSVTQAVSLRPVLVYGPGVKGNMAALFRAARLPIPLPLGALHNARSIISLATLASAIAHALVSPQVAGGTYLIADEAPVSVAQIIGWLRAGLGRSPGLISLPLAPIGAGLRLSGYGDVWARLAGDLVADTSAFTATGWQPPETTAAALAAAIRADRTA